MKRHSNERVGFLKTIDEVRAAFVATGKTYKGWAEERGYDADIVGDLLRGKTTGRRGQSHNVAVLLGLKFGAVDPAHVPNLAKKVWRP